MEKKLRIKIRKEVDSRLRRIADFLLLNASFIENLGLFNGKMGIAIFFFHYARYANNEVFEEYAGELIDEIYEEININTKVNFEDGLTGIGWGIEYLIKQGFLEGDTDDVLREIDDVIYMNIVNSPILFDNGNDLFGYGFYLLERLINHEINDENLNTLIKKKHLIFLIDECERVLIQKRHKNFNIPTLSLRTLNSVLWFIVEIRRLGLFPSKAEKLLPALQGHLIISTQKKQNINQYLQRNLTHNLVNCISDMELREQFFSILNYIQSESLEYSGEYPFITQCTEVTLYKLIYQPYMNKCALESKLFNPVLESIDNEEDWFALLDKLNKDNIGLTGLSGFGFSLLQNIENNSINHTSRKITQNRV